MFEQVSIGDRRSALGDWIVRGAIAAVFVLFGAEKFPSGPESEWVGMFQQIGLGQWFRYFTGVVEILGGVLVLIPWTVTIGLALLACTMLGAVVIVAFVLGPFSSVFPGVFLIGLVVFGLSRRN
jgi:putative oxidoreductase